MSGSVQILAMAARLGGEWYSRGYLPHRDRLGLLQSITFRLADRLPQAKLNQLGGGAPQLVRGEARWATPSADRGVAGRGHGVLRTGSPRFGAGGSECAASLRWPTLSFAGLVHHAKSWACADRTAGSSRYHCAGMEISDGALGSGAQRFVGPGHS